MDHFSELDVPQKSLEPTSCSELVSKFAARVSRIGGFKNGQGDELGPPPFWASKSGVSGADYYTLELSFFSATKKKLGADHVFCLKLEGVGRQLL